MTAIAAKADTSWIQDFRNQYEAWFVKARPLIETHQHAVAFKDYPFPVFNQTPWAPVQQALPDGRLGFVSTAALYRQRIDIPFADTTEGDSQVIELPRDTEARMIDTAHTHIPQEMIKADVNVALPVDHFRALVNERRIGAVASRFFSINGYRTRADDVALETAPKIAKALVEDGVTHALIVPV
jgi:hypothetical protein